MTDYRFFHIDAFAERPMAGGPAAVMPMDRFPADAEMQAIAAENNLAETAFLVRRGPGLWSLRWFTPTLEVPLCGHATLAAAHALFTHLGFDGEEVRFETKSGALAVRWVSDGRLEMDFPAVRSAPIATPAGLAEALGETPSEVLAGIYLLAVFDEAAQVRRLAPDIAAVARIAGGWGNGGRGNIICAAPGDDGFDVVSRFFAPGSGVSEDPATGSAHCAIAPFFSERLGKSELHCFQAYPRRGAHITTRMAGERVKLIGRARTVIEGVFHG